MRLCSLGTKGLFQPVRVLGIVTFEEANLTFVTVVQDMGRHTVKEPTVVRDHHRTAWELKQRFFKGSQCFYVQVIGWLIEQQYVAAGFKQLGQVNSVTLTTR